MTTKENVLEAIRQLMVINQQKGTGITDLPVEKWIRLQMREAEILGWISNKLDDLKGADDINTEEI